MEFSVTFTVKRDRRLPVPMLYCNMSLGGSRKTFSMKIHATHKTWDPFGRLIKGDEKSTMIIQNTYTSLYRINAELQSRGVSDLDKVKEVFDGKVSLDNKGITVVDVCEQFLDLRTREGAGKSTTNTIKATTVRLTGYTSIFYQGACSILDIERDFYPNFKVYLLDQGLSHNSINQYLGCAKSILDYGEMIEPRFRNPSKWISYFKALREYKSLSGPDVSKIKDIETLSHLRPYADLFMIQVLTGMGYSELKAFEFSENLIWDGPTAWINIKRKKTGKLCEIPVPLGFWTHCTKDAIKNNSLPVPSLTLYNKKLKLIAEELGIEPFTSHQGRHTFATEKINDGWTMESVARMIGDTVTTTERVYANIKSDRIKREIKDRNNG